MLLGRFVSHSVSLLVGVSIDFICGLTALRLSKSFPNLYFALLHFSVLESIDMLLVFLTFFIQPHDLKKTCKNSAGIIFFRRKHHFHRTQMVAPIYSLNLMYHPTTGCDTPFSSTALGKSCFSVRKGASQLGIRGPIPMSRYSPYTYLQHSLNWGQVYIYILYILYSYTVIHAYYN